MLSRLGSAPEVVSDIFVVAIPESYDEMLYHFFRSHHPEESVIVPLTPGAAALVDVVPVAVATAAFRDDVSIHHPHSSVACSPTGIAGLRIIWAKRADEGAAVVAVAHTRIHLLLVKLRLLFSIINKKNSGARVPVWMRLSVVLLQRKRLIVSGGDGRSRTAVRILHAEASTRVARLLLP